MDIMKLETGMPSAVTIKKGMCVKCISGIVWLTASGKDYILYRNDELVWEKPKSKAVMLPVNTDSEISISRAASFFQELPLLNKKIGFSGSFAG